jgi:fatty-acyl-CoA synthase
LYTHPDVGHVQVIGIPDAIYGEEAMAWIKLREGATATAEDLAAFCKCRIATFKIPRHWKFVEDFPMTATGKIQKFRMREIALADLASIGSQHTEASVANVAGS